ncbi:MAG TPA: molybdopterin-dependent oxidoreductase [bacterium]|nr:molybdopterin-dependent oxidoreductase [bacterium]
MNVPTVCPFCGCGCGLILEVEQNRVCAAFPQRSHPVSRGTLCIKGWNSHEFIHHPQRLTHPLIKKNGVFKQASWSQAIAFAAQGLQRVQERYGAHALGVVGSVKSTNEEQYLLARFSRSVLQTANLDTAMRLHASPTVRGLLPHWGYGAAGAAMTDLESAKAILIVGANPKAQSANLGSFILQAAKRGSRVLLIDSREQDHSRFYGQQIRPRPNTYLLILQAMLQTIISNGWQRPAAALSSGWKEKLAAYSAERAAAAAGVTAQEIRSLTESFATAETAVIVYGDGITQHADGLACVHALWNLAVITGNLDKAGCGLLPLMNSNNMQGSIDMGMATELLPGHAFLTDRSAADHFSRIWNCSLPEEPGKTLPEMVRQAGTSLRALYVVGENLAASMAAAPALARLDFLVVQDLFLTETAQAAHVVLPACSFAEKEGTVTNLERRVQRIRKAIAPLGESKPDAEIITLLANKLGSAWPDRDALSWFGEMQNAHPAYGQLDVESVSHPGGAVWPVVRNGSRYAYAPIEAPTAPGDEPDAEFPFLLTMGPGRLHRMTGTLIQHSFTLEREEPFGLLEVNPEDAKALKCRSGSAVRIKTRQGEWVGQAAVTRAVLAGTLHLSVFDREGKALALLGTLMDPRTKIPLKVCAARLEMA